MPGHSAADAGGIAPISRRIWDLKYRLKTPDGAPIDTTIEDSWRCGARALAAPEQDSEHDGEGARCGALK